MSEGEAVEHIQRIAGDMATFGNESEAFSRTQDPVQEPNIKLNSVE